ncbi:unnamed protein product [Absidia cylindrospora]
MPEPPPPLASTTTTSNGSGSATPSHHTSSSSLALTPYQFLHSPSNPASFYPPSTTTTTTGSGHGLRTGGCPHVHLIKSPSSSKMEEGSLLANYRALVKYALNWAKLSNKMALEKKKRHRNELPLPQCSVCSDSLSRLHVCLHCVYMGCWKKGHMRHHLKAKKHTFAMDFTRCMLYCGDCQDYIYDTELMDRVVRLETLKSDLGSRRFRLRWKQGRRWTPYQEEIDTIVQHATLVSCQGIRGLCNMGNTCFMNVILQSFIHNPLLKAYFLSDQHNPKKCSTKYCLCCEMDRLFAEIYSPRKEPYGPCHFLQAMWMSLRELAGYAQQDAHEFFISALNHIHAGCKDNTMVDCQCIVHKTFAGVLQSNVTCSMCGNVTTTHDPMLDISLGLRPMEKKKKANNNNNSNSNATGTAALASPTSKQQQQQQQNGSKSGGSDSVVHDLFANSIASIPPTTTTTTVSPTTPPSPMIRRLSTRQGNTLVDCLDRYTQPEKLGRNEYVCSNCSTFQEATKQLSIERLPSVLSFQLKRFEHGVAATKIETKIKFPVELDMTPYTTKGKKRTNKDQPYHPNPSNLYTLFAVVNHQGRMDTGHYTMFARHREEWFKFDDHHVTMAYQRDVLESKAYMCFYVKKILDYEE